MPAKPPCQQCGQPHVTRNGQPSCAGHAKHTNPDRQAAGLLPGAPCRKAPMRGQTMCATHGGRAPQAKAAAEHRIAQRELEADAAALLASEGLEPVDDPVGEIGRLVVEALAFKRAAGARVNALDSIRYRSDHGNEQLRSEVALYERAMDRSMKFLEVHVRQSGDRDMSAVDAWLNAMTGGE